MVAGTNVIYQCIQRWWRTFPDRAGEVVVQPTHIFHPMEAALRSLAPVKLPHDYTEFILLPDVEFPEPYSGLKPCFLFRAVTKLFASPNQRSLFLQQPGCEGLLEFLGAATVMPRRIQEALDHCYTSMLDACVEELGNVGAYVAAISTGSWSNLCSTEIEYEVKDPVQLASLMQECDRMFHRKDLQLVNIVLAVSSGIAHALQLVEQMEMVAELCVILVSQNARYLWKKEPPMWPVFKGAYGCIEHAMKKGVALPAFIEGPWKIAASMFQAEL